LIFLDTIAEIAFGIGKIRPDQRAARLEQGSHPGVTEAAAVAYGDIMRADRSRAPLPVGFLRR